RDPVERDLHGARVDAGGAGARVDGDGARGPVAREVPPGVRGGVVEADGAAGHLVPRRAGVGGELDEAVVARVAGGVDPLVPRHGGRAHGGEVGAAHDGAHLAPLGVAQGGEGVEAPAGEREGAGGGAAPDGGDGGGVDEGEVVLGVP